MHKSTNGQSTLEYIILVSAVVAVILIFLGPSGVFQSRLNTTFDQVSNSMTNMAGRLSNSYPLAP